MPTNDTSRGGAYLALGVELGEDAPELVTLGLELGPHTGLVLLVTVDLQGPISRGCKESGVRMSQSSAIMHLAVSPRNLRQLE
jgi:hypothetical protein